MIYPARFQKPCRYVMVKIKTYKVENRPCRTNHWPLFEISLLVYAKCAERLFSIPKSLRASRLTQRSHVNFLKTALCKAELLNLISNNRFRDRSYSQIFVVSLLQEYRIFLWPDNRFVWWSTKSFDRQSPAQIFRWFLLGIPLQPLNRQ